MFTPSSPMTVITAAAQITPMIADRRAEAIALSRASLRARSMSICRVTMWSVRRTARA